MKKIEISVVVPLYKCSKAIPDLTNRLVFSLSELTDNFEIIYINDASPENDWEEVVKCTSTDERI